ncbi:hypothetical protein SDC9_99392 [bioreactor metagenome]|uniref:Uncharacterized protein n=1 Tax=bioreactor metagenome TaxID=1076179 RepID=A0A645AHE6_9ZZZZ
MRVFHKVYGRDGLRAFLYVLRQVKCEGVGIILAGNRGDGRRQRNRLLRVGIAARTRRYFRIGDGNSSRGHIIAFVGNEVHAVLPGADERRSRRSAACGERDFSARSNSRRSAVGSAVCRVAAAACGKVFIRHSVAADGAGCGCFLVLS